MKRMPVLFAGHGSPMIAIEHNEITATLQQLGQMVVEQFGKPKGILMISAHWYTRGTWLTDSETPEQIYDMYGFPQKLYDLKYPAKGDPQLAHEAASLIGADAHCTGQWGLDHGSWSLLVHLFPDANIPVVQLSVNGELTPRQIFELGQKLIPLREKGILIIGSGALVHNLSVLIPGAQGALPQAAQFHHFVNKSLADQDIDALLEFENHPDAQFANPTPEHFLPLLYVLGAADHETPAIFNETIQSGAVDMTGFAFGF